MKRIILCVIFCFGITSIGFAACPYDSNCLNNPYGAGSPYKADGLMNPYSANGSPYSDKSWTNPSATNTPKLYNEDGKYLGNLRDHTQNMVLSIEFSYPE